MGTLTQLPGTRTPAPPQLGRCEWCREREAIKCVEIAPAKRKQTPTRPWRAGEGPVARNVCSPCAARLEEQLAAARRRTEKAKAEQEQANKARREAAAGR